MTSDERMIVEWQLESRFAQGYRAGMEGKNEEFDNPCWQVAADSQEWLRGYAVGSQDRELIMEMIENAPRGGF